MKDRLTDFLKSLQSELQRPDLAWTEWPGGGGCMPPYWLMESSDVSSYHSLTWAYTSCTSGAHLEF